MKCYPLTGAGFLFLFKVRKQAHSELCDCLRLPAALCLALAGNLENGQKDKPVAEVIRLRSLT